MEINVKECNESSHFKEYDTTYTDLSTWYIMIEKVFIYLFIYF